MFWLNAPSLRTSATGYVAAGEATTRLLPYHQAHRMGRPERRRARPHLRQRTGLTFETAQLIIALRPNASTAPTKPAGEQARTLPPRPSVAKLARVRLCRPRALRDSKALAVLATNCPRTRACRTRGPHPLSRFSRTPSQPPPTALGATSAQVAPLEKRRLIGLQRIPPLQAAESREVAVCRAKRCPALDRQCSEMRIRDQVRCRLSLAQ